MQIYLSSSTSLEKWKHRALPEQREERADPSLAPQPPPGEESGHLPRQHQHAEQKVGAAQATKIK